MKKTINLLFVLLTLTFSCNDEEITEEVVEETNEEMYMISFSGMAHAEGFCGASNSYNIQIEHLLNDETINSEDYTGTGIDNSIENSTEFSYSSESEIALKITLTDFDENDMQTGRGTILDNMIISIANGDGTKILEKDLSENLNEGLDELFICTDSVYQLLFSYNFNTDTLTTDVKRNGF